MTILRSRIGRDDFDPARPCRLNDTSTPSAQSPQLHLLASGWHVGCPDDQPT